MLHNMEELVYELRCDNSNHELNAVAVNVFQQHVNILQQRATHKVFGTLQQKVQWYKLLRKCNSLHKDKTLCDTLWTQMLAVFAAMFSE